MGIWIKNGHALTDEQIRTTPETDWMALLTSHNTPKVIDNPFAQVEREIGQPQEQSSNPFSQFEQPATPTDAEPEQEEEKPFVPHTIWDVPFVEKELGKTKIRLFPIENEAIATEGIGEVVFDGKWDVNLMFIIYK